MNVFDSSAIRGGSRNDSRVTPTRRDNAERLKLRPTNTRPPEGHGVGVPPQAPNHPTLPQSRVNRDGAAARASPLSSRRATASGNGPLSRDSTVSSRNSAYPHLKTSVTRLPPDFPPMVDRRGATNASRGGNRRPPCGYAGLPRGKGRRGRPSSHFGIFVTLWTS
jgi:hypothetical protein